MTYTIGGFIATIIIAVLIDLLVQVIFHIFRKLNDLENRLTELEDREGWGMREPSKCDYAIDKGGVYVCRMMCLPCLKVNTKFCLDVETPIEEVFDSMDEFERGRE